MAASIDESKDVPKVINVREFLEQWSSLIEYPPIVTSTEMDKTIATTIQIPKETVDELSELCSPSTLWESDLTGKHELYAKIPEDINLATVRNQRDEIELRRKNPTYAALIGRKMKYNYSDWYKIFQPERKKIKQNALGGDITEAEVVLAVDVHKPFHGKGSSRVVISESYLVLGRNKLTDLRDVIRCANDNAVAGDFSNFPDFTGFELAKDVYKSGFFFIEGTFYNDMRLDDNRDYSEPILKWVNSDARFERIGIFNKSKMEETRFVDLNVVIGKPYYYQHQGDCEHILVFTDLRMLHPTESHVEANYPFLTREVNHRRKICKVCQINTAKWIVYDSHLIPTNPTYMCHRCFKCLLYDSQGQKIGTFTAFRSSDHPT